MLLRLRLNRVLPRITICAVLVVLLLPVALGAKVESQAESDAARRVLATSSLAAKEYAAGVSGGVVVSADEVEETRLFLGQASLAAEDLGGDVGGTIRRRVADMRALVDEIGDPERLAEEVGALAELLLASYPGIAEVVPPVRFATEDSRELYAANCAICHGPEGHGDGTAAAEHDPPPTDLTDRLLADQSPLDFFRKISLGVSGTAMPAFEALGESPRWALAWYATTLRGDPAGGERAFEILFPTATSKIAGVTAGAAIAEVPATFGDPERVARSTDEELASALREVLPTATDDELASAVAYVRTLPWAEEAGLDDPLVWASVRAEVARAVRSALEGAPEAAGRRILDAYVSFEAIETEVALRDRALATALEADFAELGGRLEAIEPGDSLPDGALRSWDQLADRLDVAQARLEGAPSSFELGFQSFLLLLREGIEAILIVGLLAAIVARARMQAGAETSERRPIRTGVVLALIASVLTAVLVESVFHLGVVQQELLEGITMLLAAAVLIFVGHWLIARVEVNAWKSFLAQQAEQATAGGSALALGGAAFLAIYREGFETVLFYKALLITAAGTGAAAIVAGGLIAAVCLVVVYVAIVKFGVRIPLRAFFAVTSVGLLYLAVSFGGRGIAELQESDLIRTTVLDGWPRLPWLGLYPTAESLALQGAILLLIAAGVVYSFLIKPRLTVADPA